MVMNIEKVVDIINFLEKTDFARITTYSYILLTGIRTFNATIDVEHDKIILDIFDNLTNNKDIIVCDTLEQLKEVIEVEI